MSIKNDAGCEGEKKNAKKKDTNSSLSLHLMSVTATPDHFSFCVGQTFFACPSKERLV